MTLKLIKNPRVTEKASLLQAEQNVHVFDIPKEANKTEVKKAIFTIYKVRPVRVNILSTKGGGKKAIVYLKEGDKITEI